MSLIHQDSTTSKTPSGRHIDEKKCQDIEEEQDVTKVNSVDLDEQKKRSRLDEYYRAVENTYRHHWWQIWKPSDPPPPPLANMDDAQEIPLANASFLSILFFTWITPMMVLGWQRALQAGDLWKMDESRRSHLLGSKLTHAWEARVEAAKAFNVELDAGHKSPGRLRQFWWNIRYRGNQEKLKEMRSIWFRKARRLPSLTWSLGDTFGRQFVVSGLFKVVGDVAQLCGPLISKSIIEFAQEKYVAHREGRRGPSIGRGIGAAIGLFILTVLQSLCQHQWFWRSMSTGVLARAALINSMYKRGLSFTSQARKVHTEAGLVNHLSTDISRIDFLFQWAHPSWTAPVQVIVCVIILCTEMGPSALAGLSVFLILTPVQNRAMSVQMKIRRDSMKYTDQRAGLLQEVLRSMRITKLFTYERPFLERIESIRQSELKGIWALTMMRAATLAIAFSIPVLAAVVAFIVYGSTGHPMNPAIVFTSLSLFNLLRQPMMFFPRSLSGITDGRNALGRLQKVFMADTLAEHADPGSKESPYAICIDSADFEWEAVLEDQISVGKTTRDAGRRVANKDEGLESKVSPNSPVPEEHPKPFGLHDINLAIPKGGNVYAIVGPVGSGKSSLIQGIVGEMRRTRGTVSLGSSVAYAAQVPWIQNATLRANVIFGRPFDEGKYWDVINSAALLPDLMILPDGDLTEIGEKGVNLSGGQKARVSLARALYSEADIVILDDPLSAVDAHVGERLFNEAILGLKAKGKTILLVTHALHFLPRVDYICYMSEGRILEQGTHEELTTRSEGAFQNLVRHFGNESADAKEPVGDEDENEDPKGEVKAIVPSVVRNVGVARGTGKEEGHLIVTEFRKTGSISSKVYMAYIVAGGGIPMMVVIILSAFLMQGGQLLTSYWLVWWQDNTFHKHSAFYMGIYAGLGIGQAAFTFLLGGSMGLLSYYASVRMHTCSLKTIFHAPMSFFDTTPLGRVLSVLGKDMDTIDNTLSDSLRLAALVLSSLAGSVILIAILEHWFLLIIAVMVCFYIAFSRFYTASSREMKRLDAILRSSLYSHFAESLSGLPTIRAYGETSRFVEENARFIDHENAALFLTITNQRWLNVRVDTLGGVMTFCVALLSVLGVNGVSPAQIGVVLSYIVGITQTLGALTRQTAEVENSMNAVERVHQYGDSALIPQEAAYEVAETAPPPDWPKNGAISIDNVVMSYRPGLPPVLKEICLEVEGGQKIGIVGRTGAGKTSLMAALFRLIELSSGSIRIDGLDISRMGLYDLRSRISIIPQEPLIFSGTIRTNLDPFSDHQDVDLYDALRRSHLGDADGKENVDTGETPSSRYSLDTSVDAEGANLSVGERSLLSLARALCRDSQVVVMDEATASVDLETDAKVQETVMREFHHKTILCIAHRLRTIINYDKILVLDQGEVTEFGPPLELFDEGGLFATMCERSSIGRNEIVAAMSSRARLEKY